MKKHVICILLCMFGLLNIQAQKVTVKQNSYDKIRLNFSIDNSQLQVQTLQMNGTNYDLLTADGLKLSQKTGMPQLPVNTQLIEIPLCGDVHVSYTFEEPVRIQGAALGVTHPLAPAQINYHKSYRGERIFSKDETVYSNNDFVGEALAKVEKNGIYRNVNLATVCVSPIRYNPVSNEFEIYQNIDVEITFDNMDVEGTQTMKRLHGNQYFAQTPGVINPFSAQTRDAYSAPVKYLIVSHSMFRGQLDNFVNWKKRKGFLVEVAYTDDANVGTTYNSIAAYIKSQYTNATIENPAPTFVLLVGDVAQIPTKQSSLLDAHPTDLYYFDWTNDGIPDCYYGRFSASSIAQLTPQINKTLMYEQVTMEDPSYLDNALLIAGVQDEENYGWYYMQGFGYTHGNSTIQYIFDNYVNSTYGYTTVNCFKNPHPSGIANTIKSVLSNGVGIANYTAHGDVTEWSDPHFTSSNINSMTNKDKYPLMIGNCCLSNKFDETSLGESLLRAVDKGAAGYIGGSCYTYWDQDVYWAVGYRSYISTSTSSPSNFSYDASNLGAYDRLFHTHNETFPNWYTTFGSMIHAGNLAVQSVPSSDYGTDDEMKNYYWEIYHLCGDPSVMTWLTQPEEMVVTSDSVLSGCTSVNVHTVPYAYVALTDSLNLLAAAFADANGEVTLSFPDISDFDNVELAVSAQNYKTNFSTLNIKSPDFIGGGNEGGEGGEGEGGEDPINNIADNANSTYKIVPNPASSYIEVTVPVGQELRLFDVSGKWLKNIETTGTTTRIDISDLTAGFYFIKSGKTTMKFIKK